MADYTLEGPQWTAGTTIDWYYAGTPSAYPAPNLFPSELLAAFTDWSSKANIHFQQVTSPTNAEITVGWQEIDGPGNTLGVTDYTFDSTDHFLSADINFDDSENWQPSSGEEMLNSGVTFASVALHEIGHALGLDHYTGGPAIMNPIASPSVTDLTQSDIDGIQALYGPATTAPAPPSLAVTLDEWILSNGQWAASVSPGSHPAGSQVAGVGDFNHDGTSDILWYNSSTGDVDEWQMANGKWAASIDLGAHPGSGWQIAGTGDFNGDGTSDVLWFNSGTGQTDIWELLNGKWSASVSPGSHPTGYQVAGVGDFNHDGTSGLLFYNPTSGDVDEWKIVNGKWAGSVDLGSHPGSGWQIGGVGDFNGDGTSDVLWFNSTTGRTDIWELLNGKWSASVSPGTHPTGYQVAGIGDFNHDGTSDILFYNPTTGDVDEWKISNGKWAGSVDLGAHSSSSWQIAGVGDFNHDGTSDVLWHM